MLAGIGVILTNLHAFGYDPDFIGDLSFAQPDGKIRFLKYLIL
jgi:hypothetical protein